MNISDRDKKLIYILLIAMIIFLPYFFFIKDKRVETDDIKSENESLKMEYDDLVSLKNQCEAENWEARTAEMKQEVKDIVNTFPADIRPENYTMFLLNTEYSSFDDVLGWVYPIWFQSSTYGTNVSTPISSDTSDTGYVALSNKSSIVYEVADYESLKYMLGYLMAYKDPMVFSGITMEFVPQTGNIKGEIVLDQYAIIGGEDKDGNPRILKPVVIDPKVEEAYGRGNTEVGVFGPREIVVGEDTEGGDKETDDAPADDDSADEE